MENPENGKVKSGLIQVVIAHDPATGNLGIQSQANVALVMGILHDALLYLEEQRRSSYQALIQKQDRPRILTPAI